MTIKYHNDVKISQLILMVGLFTSNFLAHDHNNNNDNKIHHTHNTINNNYNNTNNNVLLNILNFYLIIIRLFNKKTTKIKLRKLNIIIIIIHSFIYSFITIIHLFKQSELIILFINY